MTKVVAKVDLSIYAWVQYSDDDPERDIKERDIIDQMVQLYYEYYEDFSEEF